MDHYFPRIVDDEISYLLKRLPALAIEGPKGVGKTSTARRQVASSLELDYPATTSLLDADPAALARMDKPVLIDEWQRFPQSWDMVRRAVDKDRTPNQFVLTGSANPFNPPTHSGAGRISTIRMRSMSLYERNLDTPTVSLKELLKGNSPMIEGSTKIGLPDYARELTIPGLPGFRGLEGRALRTQIDSYLARIVDRDIAELDVNIRQPNLLLRWIRAYAAATATTSAYETIRDAASGGESNKPSKLWCQTYREILERLWILDPIPAWLPSRSPFSQLTISPKHHLADPALATRLLGLDFESLLRVGSMNRHQPKDWMTLLGRLFESLVALSVRVYAQNAEARAMHMRTQGGRQEIDVVVVKADQRVLAIEVKLAQDPSDSDTKNLHWLKNKLGNEVVDLVIVNAGPYAYRRADGIAVIPAALLGP